MGFATNDWCLIADRVSGVQSCDDTSATYCRIRFSEGHRYLAFVLGLSGAKLVLCNTLLLDAKGHTASRHVPPLSIASDGCPHSLSWQAEVNTLVGHVPAVL